MSCEIKQSDILRLILQFFKESNLPLSFQALQSESQISLNLVENKEFLASDIKQGRWDQVLKAIKSFRLPSFKLMAVYEQILYELLELAEKDLALQIFTQNVPKNIKDEFPEKSKFLETLINKGVFAFKEIGTNREKLRVSLSEMIIEELVEAPPNRLLALLGQSLKYQEYTGELKPNVSLDIFTNKVPEVFDKNVEIPTKISKKLIFPSSARINVLDISPNGQSLVLGAADGIIEVWNPIEAKLRKDLIYQQEESFMLHETPITSLRISSDSELLASGDQTGTIKIWRLMSGKCLRKLGGSGIVGYLGFRRDTSHLISGSGDCIRVYGLKSGRVLKEFRGGIAGMVNEVLVREEKVCAGGKDGVVRIFDWNSCEMVMGFRINEDSEQEVTNILELPNNGNLVVCNRRTMALISWNGVVLKRFDLEKKDIVNACLSLIVGDDSKGYIYAVGSENVLYCINYQTGAIESNLKYGEKGDFDIIGMKQHPLRNLLIMWSMNGVILYFSAN